MIFEIIAWWNYRYPFYFRLIPVPDQGNPFLHKKKPGMIPASILFQFGLLNAELAEMVVGMGIGKLAPVIFVHFSNHRTSLCKFCGWYHPVQVLNIIGLFSFKIRSRYRPVYHINLGQGTHRPFFDLFYWGYFGSQYKIPDEGTGKESTLVWYFQVAGGYFICLNQVPQHLVGF